MGFHNRTADRETQSSTGWLGRYERREQSVDYFLIHTWSCVRDADLNCVFRAFRCAQHYVASLRRNAFESLDRIAYQVKDNLLDLHAVDQHLRQVGSEV